MGTTVLQITSAGDGAAVASFRRLGSGAERWRRIVDAFDEALDALRRERGIAVGRPDGDLSLGRGGRRVISEQALPLAIACWEIEPAVRDALADGSLVIEGVTGPPLVRALARRWVAENWPPISSESRGLDSYFD